MIEYVLCYSTAFFLGMLFGVGCFIYIIGYIYGSID